MMYSTAFSHIGLRRSSPFGDHRSTIAPGQIFRLRKRLGRTPEATDVVEVAKSQRSVLHSYFDWSDGEAAGRWRLHRANALLRSLKVVVQMGETVVKTPLFPSVRVAGGASSERVRIATQDLVPDEAELLREQAAADLRGYVRRYASTLVALGLERQAVALLEAVERAVRKAAA
jgi:hypothetical protein